jgi:hypothetical protein
MTASLLFASTAFGADPAVQDLGRIIAMNAKVRATTKTSKETLEAIFLEQRGDSLMVRPLMDDHVVALSITDVSRLEVSSEKRGNGMKGGVIGFATLGLLGAVAGAADASEGDEVAGALAGAIFFGGLGFLLGGLVGHAHKTDRWVEVYPEWERKRATSPEEIRGSDKQ